MLTVSLSIAQDWVPSESFFHGRVLTISTLIDGWTKSDAFLGLKPSTQKDYFGAIKQLKPVFGNGHPSNLRPTIVQRYMDKRSSNKRANVERTVLMNVYKWAMARYDEVTDNPASKAQPFKLKSRTKYITDSENDAIFKAASPPVQVAMDLS